MKKFYNCFEKIMVINYYNLNDEQVKKIDFWINKFTPSIEFCNKTIPDFELYIINDYSKYDFIEHKNIATIIGKIEGIEANIGKYVSQVFQRLLINKGIIFVHASSVYKNNKGIIIIGDYGQGKTSVALGCILKDEEISLLSDNGIAIKDNKIIGYTKSISLRQVNNKMLSIFNNKKKFDYVNRTYFDYQFEKGKNIEIASIIIPHINAEDDNNYLVDYYASFLEFCINVEKYFHGIPDYVFTDYECNVARYSYARDITLIGMEQHSKFLFLNDNNIELKNKYGIKEETSRLKFFFPKVNYRIISSFFPITNIPNSLLLPPIVEHVKNNIQNENFILAYFSPYVSNKEFFYKIYELMKNDSNNYILYTKFNFERADNILIKPFSNDFKKDLIKCKCVISTSGHQLISESINLEKPLYLLPIETFEQQYSNLMVKKYNLGMDISDDYHLFLNSLEKIKTNMIKYKQEYWKETWDIILNDYFNKSLKLEKRR